uniref:F-box domain-containing protein n=1 Tax=Oryza meridionalis TaxID=40149 RepID=A0A0E0CTD3_9ORYZ
MKNKKGSRRNRNKKSAAHNNPQLVVDRFTKLPDDLLLNILDRLNTPDAVRTCLLSKRTIHLRHLLSRFQISVDSFVPNCAHNNPQLVVDRFTKLPDDLLLNILDRLNTPDAVRTCLLSKRTIHLRHLLSRFQISVDSFVPNCGYATLKDAVPMNGAVADATDNLLTFRRQDIPLRHLSVCFYLKYYDCLTIGKAVARAMATNNLLDSVEFILLGDEQKRKQITEGLVMASPHVIHFRS